MVKKTPFLLVVGIAIAFLVIAIVGITLFRIPSPELNSSDNGTAGMSGIGPPSSVEVDEKELLKLLRTQNIEKIAGTLNHLVFATNAQDFHPLLVQLWNLDKTTHSDLQWAVIDSDVVRMAIASNLLQAERNRRIILEERDEIHEFVRRAVSSSDRHVYYSSIDLLSVIGQDQDIAMLVEIARRQDSSVSFRLAVIGLAETCNPTGLDMLRRLKSEEDEPEIEEFITEWIYRAESDKNRELYCRSR